MSSLRVSHAAELGVISSPAKELIYEDFSARLLSEMILQHSAYVCFKHKTAAIVLSEEHFDPEKKNNVLPTT